MWVTLGVLGLLVMVTLALVGAPHLFRTTPVDRVTDARGEPPYTDLDSDDLTRTALLATRTDLAPGSTAELLDNGDETFPRLWADLRSARRSIAIASYFARPGQVADTLAGILIERARAGVAVCWVYDAVGSAKLPAEYFRRLHEAGVRTAPYRPIRWYTLDRANNRSHVRSIVIDGEIGYTGGFGFDDKWLGDGRSSDHWRDCNVRLEGPVVDSLLSAFITHWAEAANELIVSKSSGADARPPETTIATAVDETGASTDSTDPAGRNESGPDERAGKRASPLALSGILFSGNTLGSSGAERLLAMTIALARRSLLITNAYFVPDDDLIDLLIAAERRGVDVRVLTNGTRIDVKLALYAGRRRYERLLAGGIRMFEYQPAVLHSKTIVADGVWSVVGTINFDNRSLAFNNEISLVARDRALGAELEQAFDADISQAREIDTARFRRRRLRERLLERLADVVWRWV